MFADTRYIKVFYTIIGGWAFRSDHVLWGISSRWPRSFQKQEL